MALFAILLINMISFAHSYYRLDLGGNWSLYDSSSGIKTIGQIPGSMYTSLLNNGIIQDPLYRQNDVNLAWIGQTNWTYSYTLTMSDKRSVARILVCEGLDSVARITINGKEIGDTDNMFVKYTFDLTDILQQGKNTVSVQFTSAVKNAAARASQSSYDIPPDCPPSVQHGHCHVNQIRKEQCSFSWDWGPSFPTQGIWKPIYVENFNSAIISGLSAVVTRENSSWHITVELSLLVAKGIAVIGQVFADLPALNISHSQQLNITANSTTATLVLEVPSVTYSMPEYHLGRKNIYMHLFLHKG